MIPSLQPLSQPLPKQGLAGSIDRRVPGGTSCDVTVRLPMLKPGGAFGAQQRAGH
jgi:hypothetical protein